MWLSHSFRRSVFAAVFWHANFLFFFLNSTERQQVRQLDPLCFIRRPVLLVCSVGGEPCQLLALYNKIFNFLLLNWLETLSCWERCDCNTPSNTYDNASNLTRRLIASLFTYRLSPSIKSVTRSTARFNVVYNSSMLWIRSVSLIYHHFYWVFSDSCMRVDVAALFIL